MISFTVPQLLAWVVAATAVFFWIVAWRQTRELRKDPDNGVVRVIFASVAWIAGLLSVSAFIFWCNDQTPQVLTVDQTQILSRGYQSTSLGLALYFRTLYKNGHK